MEKKYIGNRVMNAASFMNGVIGLLILIWSLIIQFKFTDLFLGEIRIIIFLGALSTIIFFILKKYKGTFARIVAGIFYVFFDGILMFIMLWPNSYSLWSWAIIFTYLSVSLILSILQIFLPVK